MSSNSSPPKDPLYDHASVDSKSEKEKLEKLRKVLPQLLDSYNRSKIGRAQYFYPYLLIRSRVGDRGNRPINDVFWESPDIWIFEGEPRNAPTIPPTIGGAARSGLAHTVYAHVWNLGRAPIAGVRVEFYWFNPSFTFNQESSHPIGVARVDLGPRTSSDCHKLVKCTNAWVPQVKHGRAVGSDAADECIVIRVSCIGDSINAAHPWDAWADRHIAQRNICVVSREDSITSILDPLDKNRFTDAQVQLVQVGEEAKQAVALMNPHLELDKTIETKVLAELEIGGSILLPGLKKLFNSADNLEVSTTSFVNPSILLDVGTKKEYGREDISLGPSLQESHDFKLLNKGGDLTSLVQYMDILAPALRNKMQSAKLPNNKQAQVLRLILNKENQMLGGYTIIVAGKSR